jgi:hypothetical protein
MPAALQMRRSWPSRSGVLMGCGVESIELSDPLLRNMVAT